MTIALADREVRNAIEEAVYVVLGGVREAAKRLDVSTQAVYQLIGAEVVKNRDTALKIEAATAELGRKVPAAELMALVDWTGPARQPDPREDRRRKKGNAGSARSTVTPIGTPADSGLGIQQTLRRKPRSPNKRAWNTGSTERRTGTHGW